MKKVHARQLHTIRPPSVHNLPMYPPPPLPAATVTMLPASIANQHCQPSLPVNTITANHHCQPSPSPERRRYQHYQHLLVSSL
eukprot:7789833-Lingulodinium_polyedra.AAC.1